MSLSTVFAPFPQCSQYRRGHRHLYEGIYARFGVSIAFPRLTLETWNDFQESKGSLSPRNRFVDQHRYQMEKISSEMYAPTQNLESALLLSSKNLSY